MRSHSGLRVCNAIPASGSTPALRNLRSRGRSREVVEPHCGRRAPPSRYRRNATPTLHPGALRLGRRSTSSPSDASEPTGLSVIPQGLIAPKPARSMSTLSATPCSVRRGHRAVPFRSHADRRDLCGLALQVRPDPRVAFEATRRRRVAGLGSKRTHGRDHRVLETGHVGLARRGIVRHRHDGPRDHLARCVIRHVASAIGVDDDGVELGRRNQEVLVARSDPSRVRRWMLEQQHVVVASTARAPAEGRSPRRRRRGPGVDDATSSARSPGPSRPPTRRRALGSRAAATDSHTRWSNESPRTRRRPGSIDVTPSRITTTGTSRTAPTRAPRPRAG